VGSEGSGEDMAPLSQRLNKEN